MTATSRAAGVVLVAGVDSSTQSCKIVVCESETGRIVRTSRASHPAHTEVSAEEWWRAFERASAEPGLREGVQTLAGGQQHGMVTLDGSGNLVRDALLWNDNWWAADASDLIAATSTRYGRGTRTGTSEKFRFGSA